jgi:hypothetical protein
MPCIVPITTLRVPWLSWFHTLIFLDLVLRRPGESVHLDLLYLVLVLEAAYLVDISPRARGTSTRADGLLVDSIALVWERGVQGGRGLECVDTSWLASVGERIVDSGQLLLSVEDRADSTVTTWIEHCVGSGSEGIAPKDRIASESSLGRCKSSH